MSARPSTAAHPPPPRPQSGTARHISDSLMQSMTRARNARGPKPSTSHSKSRPPPPLSSHHSPSPSPSQPHSSSYTPFSFSSSPSSSPSPPSHSSSSSSSRRTSWNLHDLNSSLPLWPPQSLPHPSHPVPEEDAEAEPDPSSTSHRTPSRIDTDDVDDSLPPTPRYHLPLHSSSSSPSPSSRGASAASSRPVSRLSSRTPSMHSPSPSRTPAQQSRPTTSLPDFPPPSLFTTSTLHSHCSHYHSFPSLLQLQREKEAHQTSPTQPSSAAKASHTSPPGRPRSPSRVPIIIGNFFQGSGGWGEEEKVAVTGGQRVAGSFGSEEGRSRPVSSRGSRR